MLRSLVATALSYRLLVLALALTVAGLGAWAFVNLPVDAGWLVATPWRSYGGVRPPRNASPIGRDAHSPPVSPLNGLSQ